MTDKSKELNASIRLINDKLHFTGTVGNNDPVSIDYIAPLGDNLGYTSLELLLLSLESCIGSAVLTFLRRMGRTITSCEISARGLRREEHPTGFRGIFVDIDLKSADVTEEERSSYPKRPVLNGGRADILLQQYDNLYADLSANSGLTAMTRDPEFTKDFFIRNQNKLLYGSDIVSRGQIIKNHQVINTIDVEDAIKKKIFYLNSKKLFNI